MTPALARSPAATTPRSRQARPAAPTATATAQHHRRITPTPAVTTPRSASRFPACLRQRSVGCRMTPAERPAVALVRAGLVVRVAARACRPRRGRLTVAQEYWHSPPVAEAVAASVVSDSVAPVAL